MILFVCLPGVCHDWERYVSVSPHPHPSWSHYRVVHVGCNHRVLHACFLPGAIITASCLPVWCLVYFLSTEYADGFILLSVI